MANDGNYTYSIPRKGTNDRAISSRPTTSFLTAQIALNSVNVSALYHRIINKNVIVNTKMFASSSLDTVEPIAA